MPEPETEPAAIPVPEERFVVFIGPPDEAGDTWVLRDFEAGMDYPFSTRAHAIKGITHPLRPQFSGYPSASDHYHFALSPSHEFFE